MGTFSLHDLQVFQLGLRALLPHLFEPIDLLRLDLTRPLILKIRRGSDQPAEKGFVLDERHPVVGVVGALFHTELAQARLSAQQNHVRLGLGWHETQEENVGALA